MLSVTKLGTWRRSLLKEADVFGGRAIEMQHAQSCGSCSYRVVVFSQGWGYGVGEAPLR